MSIVYRDGDAFVNSRLLSTHLEDRVYAVPDAFLCVYRLLTPRNISLASCPKRSLRFGSLVATFQKATTGRQMPDTKTGETQGGMTRPGGRRGDADTIYDKRRTAKKSLRACVLRLCAESCQIRCRVQGGRASGSRYEQSLNLQEIVTASTAQMLNG